MQKEKTQNIYCDLRILKHVYVKKKKPKLDTVV